MQLKNYMEDLVWEKIKVLAPQKAGCCQCERCCYDVAAIALNAMPPRYFVTEMGKTYARITGLDQQFNADLTTAVVNAMNIVAAKPRHSQSSV